MRILHTYCLNYNIGDYALGIGQKNLFREFLDVDFIGETNLQGRNFDEYYINEVVNKRYDLLVIGGGGIIHGAHWPNGWFWLIDQDLIKSIKIPFIVYGAGVNYWEEEGGIPPKAISHLRETIKHASFFSLRNDGSAKRFENQVGIKPYVLPDPGFHINLNCQYERKEEKPYVLIQLANDKPESRYGNAAKIDTFIQNLRATISDLAQQYQVIMAPHVFDDIALSKQVSEGIPNTKIWDFSHFAFDNCKEAIAYYQNAEFVISMRGHGQIVPIAFNTPVISIVNHPKHLGLMKELALSEYVVDVNGEDFLHKLQSLIHQVINNKEELQSCYKNINKQLLLDSKKAFEEIKKHIQG